MSTAILVEDGLHGAARLIELDGALKTYQDLVGGWIQLVNTEESILVIDEEGKVNRRPVNGRATNYLYDAAPEWRDQDVLVGTVVIIGQCDDIGEPTNPPEAVLKYFGLA